MLYNKHKICAEVAWVEQRQTYLKGFWILKHLKKTFSSLCFKYHNSNCEKVTNSEMEIFENSSKV